MKQIVQNLADGAISLVDVPCPVPSSTAVLIATNTSLISAGTERMLLDFGRSSWLGKIKQQPDKVKMVLEKIKTNGLLTTIDAIQTKLSQPLPLGYCNAGTVIAVGNQVTEFKPGDRVLSNGHHAEMVHVNQNLCVKIPDEVSDEQAVFAVLGAIGLQGVRLAAPTIGEYFVVIGLGLIGLLTVQTLLANGCKVLGLDFDANKIALAKQCGADVLQLMPDTNPVDYALHWSNQRGVDGVIITAATKSTDPVHHAAKMSRQRGRIILVGVVGLELSRADFYEKELSFQVSCSYGPGRYDQNYEEKGYDYPIGFVRWTEKRNFEAILDLMAAKKIDATLLASHHFELEKAKEAYEVLAENTGLGILLHYSQDHLETKLQRQIQLKNILPPTSGADVMLGLIGPGNHASRTLLPAFKKTHAIFKTIISSQGISAAIHGQRQGFSYASTEIENLLADQAINALVIATRPASHCDQVIAALEAGKHVYVEKPLVVSQSQLERVKACYENLAVKPILMTGFNRRFAPFSQAIKRMLANLNTPKAITMTFNPGFIPLDNWIHDPDVGGGRLISEACHYIDLARFFVDHPIVSSHAFFIDDAARDNAIFSLQFADGSIANINYLANGHKSFPKERIEIFCAGKIVQIDNFIKMKGYGCALKKRLLKQNKGQVECVNAFVEAIKNGEPSPIAYEEMIEIMQTTLDLTSKIARSSKV